MSVEAARAEVRDSYVGGGPGTVVSGLVWLAAAIVLMRAGTAQAFATLFIGGMLIAPVASIVTARVFRRPVPSRGNAFVPLGPETAIAMIGGLLAAWLLLPHAPELVFPVAAITVGTRYFSFATLFGNRAFWLLGGALAAIGVSSIWGRVSIPGGPALAVAVTEIAFGVMLTITSLRRQEA